MTSAKFLLALLAVGLTAGVGHGQEVVDSVDVGCNWVGSLAYNSRANVLYGASALGRVFTIDCATNRLLSWIGVRQPFEVCYNSLDNKAYCTFWDSVLVISGDSHTRIGSIPVPMASNLVWDARTNRLYVSGYEEDIIGVIDCRTDSLLCLIPVSGSPLGLDLNTRHPKLYARCVDDQNVAVIDLTTNQVARVVPTGGNLLSSCYAGSVDKYYCDGEGGTTVIHGADDTVVAIIPWPVAMGALSMLAVDAHSLTMVGIYGQNRGYVQVVSGPRDSVVTTLQVEDGPRGMAWSSLTDLVYCACYPRYVSVLRGDGTAVVGTLTASSVPLVIAHAAWRRRVYVGHSNSRMVYVVRDTVTGIGENPSVSILTRPPLRAAPNPFTNAVMLLSAGGAFVGQEVEVHALGGSIVAAATQVRMRNGEVVFRWDGRDSQGKDAPPGVYFVSLGAPGAPWTKIVKLR